MPGTALGLTFWQDLLLLIIWFTGLGWSLGIRVSNNCIADDCVPFWDLGKITLYCAWVFALVGAVGPVVEFLTLFGTVVVVELWRVGTLHQKLLAALQ